MRKFILILLVFCVLAGGAVASRRYYRQWKVERTMSQARQAFERGDYHAALLWLRGALKANAANVEAVRLMGEFAELSQSPNAIAWRRRLVELQPTSVTNRLLLARVAIVHRDYDTAKTALDGVDTSGKKSAEYLKVSGSWAVATGQFPEAETNFREAMRLEPDNPIPRLNLAMLLVQRTDPQLAADGLQTLERLRTNAAVRDDALRHLALDAVRRTNYPRALSLVGELVRETNTPYSDRLLHLTILSDSKNPQLPGVLAGYQHEASTNAVQAFALSRWMLDSLGAMDAKAWLGSLSPGITTNLPVSLVMADACVAGAKWSELQAFLGPQDWAELDYLRMAYLCRALREQGLSSAARAEWSKALKAAEGRLDRLESLQLQTANWVWVPELEEVLWQIVNRFPAEKRAVKVLLDLLTLAGKTRSLLTLYAQEVRLDPGNLAIKNNLASIALLLNSSEHRPHELAREVYERQRDNPVFVTTYAYSLHLLKRSSEALALMNQLKPEDLEQPGIAGYYGLLLSAAGERTKAKAYFERSAQARLLPEEVELFKRSR